jgi:hypothetical protein
VARLRGAGRVPHPHGTGSRLGQVLQGWVRPIDKNLSGQVDLATREFRQLLELALYHFVQLDKELLSQCRAILAIRDPLQSLLRE